MQLLKELLLWFSKYLSTSSVVSIKGTWADIKAPSRIIYPWQPDCTFHLKCEAELQCRNETANLQPGPRQLLTEMATLGFTCKMWWDVYNLIKGTCIILVKMWEIERKKKNALQMYKAKASKVLLLMFLSDLVRVNNASSFKDEVSSTDLLLFSFSLVLIPVVFFFNKIHMYSHILWRQSE